MQWGFGGVEGVLQEGCKALAVPLQYCPPMGVGRPRKHFNAAREDCGQRVVSLYTQGVSRILRSYILTSGRNCTVGSA